MTNLEVFLLIVILLIVIGGGVILYLALAGLAIIYSMGANDNPNMLSHSKSICPARPFPKSLTR